jgi:transcriptional regulator
MFYMSSTPSAQTELLKGTLDLMILRTLELQPLHGLGIAARIGQMTQGLFDVKPGSLFPALHRLEQEGWIAGEWGESENGRRARFYTLTPAGRRQLSVERRTWERIVVAMTRLLDQQA